MLVPLYGFVAGDSMGVVVLVQDQDTIARVGQVLCAACEVRVRLPERFVVLKDGVKLELTASVAEAGLEALDRIDLMPEG